MHVVYDGTKPQGVGSLMRISDWDSVENSFAGKAVLWGFAMYGAASLVNFTKPHAKVLGYAAAGLVFLRNTVGKVI